MTNDSILKLAGAFHGLNTSRIRFWAFSYSIGEPCGRSNQLITYFIGIYLLMCWSSERLLFGRANVPKLSGDGGGGGVAGDVCCSATSAGRHSWGSCGWSGRV